jgi:RNA polymerase sporulation-specific sigma factor
MTRLEKLIADSQAGDAHAKEVLLNENTGLIWAVTKRFIGRGVEADDLYQLGCMGFIKAVDGFDLEYGTQFSTYAVPKIAGEIRRFLRDDGAVKVSRNIKEQAAQIKTARNSLMSILGREPTVTELSRQTGIAPEQIALVEGAMSCVESINQPAGDDGFTLENILTDTDTEDAFLEKIALWQAIASFPLLSLVMSSSKTTTL